MKKAIILATKTLFLSALLLFAFSSCEKPIEPENNSGQLKFTFSASDFQNNLKSATDKDSTVVYTLLVTIKDKDGNLVLDTEPVELYKFSDGFVSKKIELKEGSYSLTEFMVVNSDAEVMYATPKEGAPLAYLVNKPLPVGFIINANSSVGLRVEVIPVGNHPPEDFGYISFGISIVKPLTFYTAAYINNPIIMAPSRFVKAQLDIYDPEGKQYQFKLEAKVNKLVIKAMRGKYVFVVKTEAYEKKFMFGWEDLIKTSAEEPLLLPLGDNSGIRELLIRTSPENTKDALITNLDGDTNFGDHVLFAASFKSEPVLTVMRTTRSVMYTDIRRQLPKSATIIKVELELTVTGIIYTMQTDATDYRPMYTGVLRQVVEEWKEEGVTWNNQPKTVEANQVIIYYNPWIDFNKRIYDITPLFVPVDKINVPNYGFMLSHYPEDIPGGIEFGSSDAKNEDYRPLFKVYYTLPM